MLLRRYHKKKEKEIAEKEMQTMEEIYVDVEYEEEIGLESLTVGELKEMAKEVDIKGYSKMKKEELIAALAGD